MRTLKTMMMAIALAAAPGLAVAQDAAAPAPAAAATATPAPAAPAAPAVDAATTAAAAPAAAAPAATPPAPPITPPTPGIGMPDGRMGIQDQFTEVGTDGAWMHDVVLMPIITLICILVLALLVWVIIRYRRSANPVPSKTSHNTVIEVIWTLVPVLILVAIAVPSIQLLAKQYAPPKADLTIKVIGNQWYWTYQYPDHGDFEIVSNMLKEKNEVKPGERARTDLDGPRLLAVDERMVVPAGAVVKLIVTSADVIHSFAVPAFWSKMDAVPGRLNETWFKVDRPGVYFGQCSELCGARHAYMPIAVDVLPPAQFAAWVASKGGTMPGPAGAKNPDATATSPALGNAPDAQATAGGSATETSPEPSNIVDAVATPPVSTQGATNSRRGDSQ